MLLAVHHRVMEYVGILESTNQLFYIIAGGIVHQIRREKNHAKKEFLAKRFAHAMSVHYRDFDCAALLAIYVIKSIRLDFGPEA